MYSAALVIESNASPSGAFGEEYTQIAAGSYQNTLSIHHSKVREKKTIIIMLQNILPIASC